MPAFSRDSRRRRADRIAPTWQAELLEDRCLLAASPIAPESEPAVLATKHLAASEEEIERFDRTRTPAPRAANSRAAPKGELLPDLTVWANEGAGYMYDWRVDSDEPLMPGRTILRLTNAIANIGSGPLEIYGGDIQPDGTQQVFQRVHNRRAGFNDRLAGTFIFHDHHSHVHFEDFAQYNLREVTEGQGVGPVVASGGKVSFCLLDVEQYDTSLPRAPRSSKFDTCHATQGISVGWADVYSSGLADQWIDITGLPAIDYWLESVVDPSDRILESDETNNVTRILISLGASPADDFADDLTGAAELPLTSGNATQAGRIEMPQDVDVFSFVAPRKGKVTVTQQSTAGGLDSYLRVYDANQRLIAENDDHQNKLDSRVRFKAVAGLRYFAKAGAFSSGTGQYMLTVSAGARRP